VCELLLCAVIFGRQPGGLYTPAQTGYCYAVIVKCWQICTARGISQPLGFSNVIKAANVRRKKSKLQSTDLEPCTRAWITSKLLIKNGKSKLAKTKLELSHYTPWRHRGERMYGSYSFTTSALDGGEWSASRPGRALLPGIASPVPIAQEAGCDPEPILTQRLQENDLCLCRGSNLYRPVVQPVARHYTGYSN
jgi:hypothetical protein